MEKVVLTVEMLNHYKDLVRENIKAWPHQRRLKGMKRDLSEAEMYLICQIEAAKTVMNVWPGVETVLENNETESVWID